MLLERNGITIEVISPLDINRMKSYGYKQVKGVKAPKAEAEPLGGASKEEEKPAVEIPAGIKLAMESLGLESPEGLSEIPDKAIMAVKGVGRGALKSIRKAFPLAAEKEGG